MNHLYIFSLAVVLLTHTVKRLEGPTDRFYPTRQLAPQPRPGSKPMSKSQVDEGLDLALPQSHLLDVATKGSFRLPYSLCKNELGVSMVDLHRRLYRCLLPGSNPTCNSAKP